MAVAVTELIIAARSTHESFAPEAHPDSVCLVFLSRYHRMLMSKVIQQNPHQFSSVQTILYATWDAAWDKGDTGVAALDHHVYMPGRANHTDTESWDILRLAAWEARPREFRQINDAHWPAYSLVGGNVYLHGDQADWDRYASIDIRYVPMTADLTLAGVITLPDSAEQALVSSLVYHLCQRSANANNPGAPNCAYFREDWMEAERTFMNEISGYQKHHASVTLDIW